MSKSKTKANLADINYFNYSSDLKIEPIIKVSHDATFYQLKTTKDESVDFVNGEIKVVTNEVTALKSKHNETEQVYSASALQQEVTMIAALAKANQASLDGQVIIRESEGDEDRVYRVLVDNNRVTVEQGKPAVAWPDGTTSPLWDR